MYMVNLLLNLALSLLVVRINILKFSLKRLFMFTSVIFNE